MIAPPGKPGFRIGNVLMREASQTDSVSGNVEGIKPVQNAGVDRAAVDQKLGEARELARLGDLLAARLVCAEIVLAHKPLLCSTPALLTATTESLVHARSWHLLEHLLLAALGRNVRFAVGPESAAEEPAHFIRRTEAQQHVTYVASASLFTHPQADALIAQWSRTLTDSSRPARRSPRTRPASSK